MLLFYIELTQVLYLQLLCRRSLNIYRHFRCGLSGIIRLSNILLANIVLEAHQFLKRHKPNTMITLIMHVLL